MIDRWRAAKSMTRRCSAAPSDAPKRLSGYVWLCIIRHHAHSEWIERAATEKVSETVAAAVLLICESRPVHEVVANSHRGSLRG